jgi:predicted PurR-regulated permease PerM
VAGSRPSDEDEEKPKLQDAQDAVVDQAAGAAWRVVDGLVALVIVIFTGLYLAAHPQPYIRGILRMFPLARRNRIGEVLYACGYTLRWWLFGQLLAMAVVGLMMGVGLAIIGVPLAFALGVVAGLFEFIPTIGPMLGLLPALVLGLTDGGRHRALGAGALLGGADVRVVPADAARAAARRSPAAGRDDHRAGLLRVDRWPRSASSSPCRSWPSSW